MASVKKLRKFFVDNIDYFGISKNKALAALKIEVYERNKNTLWREINEVSEYKQRNRIIEFEATYHHPYKDTIVEIEKWVSISTPALKILNAEVIYSSYVDCFQLDIQQFVQQVDKEPINIANYIKNPKNNNSQTKDNNIEWVFKGFVYEVKGLYTDDEVRLLILEDFDKERRLFEKLKSKFDSTNKSESTYERPRIPESVRIEVWRRDGGKCARCGSREKLEYDHIVPISKGGSNTARNIELLCEKHNRSKSNNIV